MNDVGFVIGLAIVCLIVAVVIMWRDEKGKAVIRSAEAKAENRLGDWIAKLLARFK